MTLKKKKGIYSVESQLFLLYIYESLSKVKNIPATIKFKHACPVGGATKL